MELVIYLIVFFLGLFFGSLIQKFFLSNTTYMKPVENPNKRPRDDDDFYLVYDNGASYLFTETEVISAIQRAIQNSELLK